MAKILVVESSQSSREALVQTLERHGHVCLQADDGEAALQQVYACEPFDLALVMTGVEMPHLDGLGLLRSLRILKIQTPVIFMIEGNQPPSGYAEDLLMVLRKTVDEDTLIAAVQKVLSKP